VTHDAPCGQGCVTSRRSRPPRFFRPDLWLTRSSGRDTKAMPSSRFSTSGLRKPFSTEVVLQFISIKALVFIALVFFNSIATWGKPGGATDPGPSAGSGLLPGIFLRPPFPWGFYRYLKPRAIIEGSPSCVGPASEQAYRRRLALENDRAASPGMLPWWRLHTEGMWSSLGSSFFLQLGSELPVVLLTVRTRS